MATKTKGTTTSHKGAQHENHAEKHATSHKATKATSGSKAHAPKGKGAQSDWSEGEE